MARPSLDEDDTFLTIQDIAEHYRVSTRTVRRWIADGKIEIVQVGRMVRIRRSVYIAFLRRRCCLRIK